MLGIMHNRAGSTYTRFVRYMHMNYKNKIAGNSKLNETSKYQKLFYQ